MGHAHATGEPRCWGIGLLTVSDTRTAENDESGAVARRLIEAAGHRVVDQRIVQDEVGPIEDCLHDWLARRDCEVLVITGGTGVAPRDRTVQAVSGLLDRRIDGFGELFRWLSWQQVGSAAMLSGALGGVASGKPVFALPGSPAAVELGLQQLILPELGHLLAELRR